MTCQNTKKHLTVVFKCFTQKEQNLFASTNNSYTPHCYKTTTTIPMGEMKKTPSRNLGRVGHQYNHRVHKIKYYTSFQSRSQDAFVLLKQNM